MNEKEPEKEKPYDPKAVEERWYAAWIAAGSFHADPSRPGDPFTIVIPPPNVTGSLHMGHALNITLQDVLLRYARMNGRNALWLPGTDHAGIATQNVVERELAKEGISRQELGREAFIERVWKWKEKSGGTILNQLKRLGAACDWERERFTMDEGLSRAVREAFVRLYRKGLVYRGRYIINWCPRCRTALSDLEVGERRPAAGAPVDDVSPAVDEPLPVEPDERFADRAGEPLVHREPLALPVARGAQALQLVQNRAAALLLPLPYPLDEGLPPQFLPGDPFLRELPLHHVLGGDPGVVGARKPEGVAAVHPGVSQKDVLQRDVQRVPHVEGTRDVRRGDDDREWIARPGRIGVKGSRRDPGGVPTLLHCLRVVRLLFFRFLLVHRRKRSMVGNAVRGRPDAAPARPFGAGGGRGYRFRGKASRPCRGSGRSPRG